MDTDPERRAQRHDEAEQMDRDTGITDDRCYQRCVELLPWFTWETRGLLTDGEAHDVLDMLLNRLAADASQLS